MYILIYYEETESDQSNNIQCNAEALISWRAQYYRMLYCLIYKQLNICNANLMAGASKGKMKPIWTKSAENHNRQISNQH